MAKIDKIVRLAKDKSKKRQEEILNEIKRMKKSGMKITFYSVQKRTHASKSYLYNNEVIKNAIVAEREKGPVERKPESKDAIIKAQKKYICQLEARLKQAEDNNSDSWKAKFIKAMTENEELKKQLQNAYNY